MSALPPIATAKADMPQMVMSALPPKADMCSARGDVCYGPKADIREKTSAKEKDRLAAVSLKFSQCFDQAARAFRFLRQPSRPNAPRPVAKSGSAAGMGVCAISKETLSMPQASPKLAELMAIAKNGDVSHNPKKLAPPAAFNCGRIPNTVPSTSIPVTEILVP